MAFGNKTADSYNIGVPTILCQSLTAVIQNLAVRLPMPPSRVVAQQEMSLPIIVGVLVLLLMIVIVLFWRISRKPRQQVTPEMEQLSVQLPAVEEPPPAIVTLEFSAESDQLVRVELNKPSMTIGRAADNDIVLAAPILNTDSASKHHARLRRDQDDYIVRDIGSKNGLAVNGRQTLENLLQDGDRIQFGEVEAIFRRPAGGTA